MHDVSCALWLPRRNCHCKEIKHGQVLVSQNGKLILLTEAELGNGKRQTVGSRSFTAAAITADEGTVQPSPPAIKPQEVHFSAFSFELHKMPALSLLRDLGRKNKNRRRCCLSGLVKRLSPAQLAMHHPLLSIHKSALFGNFSSSKLVDYLTLCCMDYKKKIQ